MSEPVNGASERSKRSKVERCRASERCEQTNVWPVKHGIVCDQKHAQSEIYLSHEAVIEVYKPACERNATKQLNGVNSASERT